MANNGASARSADGNPKGTCNTLVHSWKHSQEWQISNFRDLPASFIQIKSQPFDMMVGASLAKWYFALRRGSGGTQGSVKHSSYSVHLFLTSESIVEQVSCNLALRVVNCGRAKRRAVLEYLEMEKNNGSAEVLKEKQKETQPEEDTLDMEVKELVRVFKRGKGYKCGEFLRSAVMDKKHLFIPDGMITIAIDISIFDKVENVDCSGMKLVSPLSKLGTDLGALFREGLHSDFTIVCKDRTFPVHKAVLAARSQVFARMMETQMTERASGKADFKEMRPDVMEQVLLFIYTGEAPELSSMTKELFAAANELGMDELRSVCGSKLARTVNMRNICSLLLLTDCVMDESDGFKEFCMSYFEKHCAEILGTDEWIELDEANPHLAHSLMRATILAGGKRKRKQMEASAQNVNEAHDHAFDD